jgi:hypothetical protein
MTARPASYHLIVGAYCLSCLALHSLLHHHYVSACHSWLAAFDVHPTPYCALVRKTLGVLQASPLFVAGAVLANAPAYRLTNDAAGRA